MFFYKRDLDRGWGLLQLCAKVFRTWEVISLNLEVCHGGYFLLPNRE